MTRKKKVLCVLLGVIAVVMSYHYWLIYFCIPDWEPIFTTTSPDGRFSVSIYYNEGLAIRFFAMPGDGSSGPGTAILREVKTGKVLNRTMLNLVDNDESKVTWSTFRNVVIVAPNDVWKLPPPESKTP